MTLAGTGVAAAVALGLPVAAALALAAAGVLLREMTASRSPDRAAWTLFGAAVLGALPAFLAPLRALPQGELLTLMAFSAAWAVDTGAYVAGKTLGRRKLAPLISPGKTWEGSIGGFLAAAGTVAAFAWLVPGLLSWPQALGVALVIGVLGQVSGLANSMIKRAMGVKDSGTLLPGHGGALDRFDTFVLTAALLFALLA
jgi:phosphatidate cytidylyltransferase